MHIRSSFRQYWQIRPRLLFSVGAGLLCALLLPLQFSLLQRLMIGWNVLAWLYLLFLWRLMLVSTPTHIRQIARTQDESASIVLALVSISCLVSILAILFELSSAKQASNSLKNPASSVDRHHIAGVLATAAKPPLPCITPINFTAGGLTSPLPPLFPGNLTKPTYLDFAYFSFTIAVALQTADVAVGTAEVYGRSLCCIR